jgi:hypothetical protein
MEDPKQCPYCGHDAVRVVHVNAQGRELRFGFFWVFFGLSLLILIGSFFGSYGNSGNHLVSALPGIILVVISVLYMILIARMPRRFRCENAHTWEQPQE